MNLTASYLETIRKIPNLLPTVEKAYSFEEKFKAGFEPASNLHLYGELNSETGLWEIFFEFELGRVYFLAHDTDLNSITIISTPSKLQIEQLKTKSLEINKQELKGSCEDLQKSLIVSSHVNLKEIKSLKKAKAKFAQDVVLSCLNFSDSHRMGHEMLVSFIKDYRKMFNAYYKTYSFLWEDSPYKNATDLYRDLSQ